MEDNAGACGGAASNREMGLGLPFRAPPGANSLSGTPTRLGASTVRTINCTRSSRTTGSVLGGDPSMARACVRARLAAGAQASPATGDEGWV